MTEMEQLEKLIEKLRLTLQKMQKDPRCAAEDNVLENAVQKLNVQLIELTDKLTEMETEYFVSHGDEFNNQVKAADVDADKLHELVDAAATTVEILGAVEKIVKVFHPFI